MKGWTWAVVVLAVLLIVGLVAFARGPEHRRGDEVGAFRRAPVTVRA